MWAADFEGSDNEKASSDGKDEGWADFDDGTAIDDKVEPVKKEEEEKADEEDDFGDFGDFGDAQAQGQDDEQEADDGWANDFDEPITDQPKQVGEESKKPVSVVGAQQDKSVSEDDGNDWGGFDDGQVEEKQVGAKEDSPDKDDFRVFSDGVVDKVADNEPVTDQPTHVEEKKESENPEVVQNDKSVSDDGNEWGGFDTFTDKPEVVTKEKAADEVQIASQNLVQTAAVN